jgi:hypothetical protein
VEEVWVVALKGEGGVGVLGGKSTRARAGEPNDSFCVFRSRGAAKRFVGLGQKEFNFLSTALRGDPVQDVEYHRIKPDGVATFGQEFGMPYVMPDPTPRLFFRDGVGPVVPAEEYSAS